LGITGIELDARQVEEAFARKRQAPDPIGVKRMEYSRDVEGILSELEKTLPRISSSGTWSMEVPLVVIPRWKSAEESARSVAGSAGPLRPG
jgi:hypothetical protein